VKVTRVESYTTSDSRADGVYLESERERERERERGREGARESQKTSSNAQLG
jgi:hypothetical protein